MAVLWQNLPAWLAWQTTNGFTTINLSASNNGVAAVFLPTLSDTITQVSVCWSGKTGTPPTYRIGLESLSAGVPSGTYLASGNAYVDVTPTTNGPATYTLGSAYTTTAGSTAYAMTVRYQSGTVDASNFMAIGVCADNSIVGISGQGVACPRGIRLSGGSWTQFDYLPVMAPRYSTGENEFPSVMVGANTSFQEAYNSGSNPLYRGIKYTPAATVRARGILANIRLAASGAFIAELFAGSSSSPVAVSGSVTKDAVVSASNRVVFIPFPATTLTAGTVYRATLRPTTANNLMLNAYTLADAASVVGFNGPSYATTAASAGTWTDYDSGTFRAYQMHLVLDSVDTGGGIIRTGMNGGLVG